MTKTYKELKELDIEMGQLYQAHRELKDTKFGYAYKRFAEKSYYPHIKLFQQAINDVRIDNAMEDPGTKAIKMDPESPRGYMYTKEGLKNVIKAEHDIENEWDAKEIEVTPYICKTEFIPDFLADEQKEMMTGLVI